MRTRLIDRAKRLGWDLSAGRILRHRPEGYAGTNTDYQRFIVFAHQRSGSSMLVNTLNMNPAVLAFGELLVQKRIGYNRPGFNNTSSELLHLRDRDPVRFLEEHAFTPYAERFKAVGFKLFPDQLARPGMERVWPWLEAHREIGIIFLTRENLLDVYVSLMIAKRTGVFGISDAKSRQEVTITVDPAEAEKMFRRRTKLQLEARERLAGHRVLALTYEDLVQDMPAWFDRIQAFIGVPPMPLLPGTIKQETRRLDQVITNYPVLLDAWRGTEWQRFLS